MGRIKRIYYENAVYHICIRGNNKQMVLAQDQDKKSFLKTLAKFKDRFRFKLLGFVLMDNHAHMIIETSQPANISKIMQAITLSYSRKFREKYNYCGYVWQGRFKSNVIETDAYILECLNYIHNNPVRAEIVDQAKDYFWSSYHLYNENADPIAEFIQIDKLTL